MGDGSTSNALILTVLTKEESTSITMRGIQPSSEPNPLAQPLRAPHYEEATVSLTMPLDEARRVIWPFRGLNAPIGDLIEQRRIDAQDLGFAMEKANDGRVRTAARTMLAHYLGLQQTVETTQRGGPRIVQASRYLQEQEKWSFAELFYLAGVASAFALILAWQFVTEWIKGTLTIPVLVVFAVLLALCVREAYRQGRKSYREYQNYKKGREGEDKIAEKLQMYLDGHWTVFRNLVLPGDRKDDLDFVLVGPGGVWVLEVKTYAEGTRLRPKGSTGVLEHLKLRTRNDEYAAPDKRVAGNAARLKVLLGQRGVEIPWVNATLIFGEYRPVDFVATTEKVEVWQATNIDSSLAMLGAATLPNNQVERVVETLAALFKK
jgi:hypothetical protein